MSDTLLLGRLFRDARRARNAILEIQRRADRVALRRAVHHAAGQLHGVSFYLSGEVTVISAPCACNSRRSHILLRASSPLVKTIT